MKKLDNRPAKPKKEGSGEKLDLTHFITSFGEAVSIRVGHGSERVFFVKLKK